MINLTNKPEGATHYAGGYKDGPCLVFYMQKDFIWMYRYLESEQWTVCHIGPGLEPIEIPDWSIYNNTMPLSGLSDEQLGQLLRHNINDGNIEYKSVDGWIHPPVWVSSGVYRAKQKSERELFEEALINAIGDNALSIADDLFDAGFKAPKVGE
jgi:hypothetical protein